MSIRFGSFRSGSVVKKKFGPTVFVNFSFGSGLDSWGSVLGRFFRSK